MQLTPKAEAMLRKFAAGLAKANGQVGNYAGSVF